jgi:hypothetical protein
VGGCRSSHADDKVTLSHMTIAQKGDYPEPHQHSKPRVPGAGAAIPIHHRSGLLCHHDLQPTEVIACGQFGCKERDRHPAGTSPGLIGPNPGALLFGPACSRCSDLDPGAMMRYRDPPLFASSAGPQMDPAEAWCNLLGSFRAVQAARLSCSLEMCPSSSAPAGVFLACQRPNPTKMAMRNARQNEAMPAQKAIIPKTEKA